MSKRNIKLIGIMIDENPDNFKMYGMSQEETAFDAGTSESPIDENEHVGLQAIFNYIQEAARDAHFVVVYDISCPNKVHQLEVLGDWINKTKTNAFDPMLIPIGQEKEALPYAALNPYLLLKAILPEENQNQDELFKELVKAQFEERKKLYKKPDDDLAASLLYEPSENGACPFRNISFMVLGGFIAAAGIATVAIAITTLVTFGAAPLGIGIGLGAAAILVGVGLFAVSAYKAASASSCKDVGYQSDLAIH